jgi:hypothetical protein
MMFRSPAFAERCLFFPSGQHRAALPRRGVVLSFPKAQDMIADKTHDEVANAAGEDIRTVLRHGFVLLEPTANSRASGEQDPVVSDDIDWDDVDLERYLAMCG